MRIRIPVSFYSVLITRAQQEDTCIEVSQPSDCLLLERYHVQCPDIQVMTLNFGLDLISTINGPAHKESPDTWKNAVHHIVTTYRPEVCFFKTNGVQTGIEDRHQVDLLDGITYRAYWNKQQTILSIMRYIFTFLFTQYN